MVRCPDLPCSASTGLTSRPSQATDRARGDCLTTGTSTTWWRDSAASSAVATCCLPSPVHLVLMRLAGTPPATSALRTASAGATSARKFFRLSQVGTWQAPSPAGAVPDLSGLPTNSAGRDRPGLGLVRAPVRRPRSERPPAGAPSIHRPSAPAPAPMPAPLTAPHPPSAQSDDNDAAAHGDPIDDLPPDGSFSHPASQHASGFDWLGTMIKGGTRPGFDLHQPARQNPRRNTGS